MERECPELDRANSRFPFPIRENGHYQDMYYNHHIFQCMPMHDTRTRTCGDTYSYLQLPAAAATAAASSSHTSRTLAVAASHSAPLTYLHCVDNDQISGHATYGARSTALAITTGVKARAVILTALRTAAVERCDITQGHAGHTALYWLGYCYTSTWLCTLHTYYLYLSMAPSIRMLGRELTSSSISRASCVAADTGVPTTGWCGRVS